MHSFFGQRFALLDQLENTLGQPLVKSEMVFDFCEKLERLRCFIAKGYRSPGEKCNDRRFRF